MGEREREGGKGEARHEGRERKGGGQVPQNYRMTDSLANLKINFSSAKISKSINSLLFTRD